MTKLSENWLRFPFGEAGVAFSKLEFIEIVHIMAAYAFLSPADGELRDAVETFRTRIEDAPDYAKFMLVPGRGLMVTCNYEESLRDQLLA